MHVENKYSFLNGMHVCNVLGWMLGVMGYDDNDANICRYVCYALEYDRHTKNKWIHLQKENGNKQVNMIGCQHNLLMCVGVSKPYFVWLMAIANGVHETQVCNYICVANGR